MQFLTRDREHGRQAAARRPTAPCRPRAGFTLMELVMVIVIIGFIGLLGADFASRGFKGFHDTENRAATFEEGNLVLLRMEREIHDAVPNAVDGATLAADPSDLRFGMMDETAMRAVFGHYREQAPTTVITDDRAALPVGAVVSIYNRNWNDFSSADLALRRLYQVSATSGTSMTLATANKPGVIASSPRQRFYAVDRAVRYYLHNGRIMRSEVRITGEGTDISAFPADAAGQPMAAGATGLSFTYVPAALTRNATVSVRFTLNRGGEALEFHKEVHINNVP